MLNVFRSKPKYVTVKRSEVEQRRSCQIILTGVITVPRCCTTKSWKRKCLSAAAGIISPFASQRLNMIADEGSFAPSPFTQTPNFPGYPEKIQAAQQLTGPTMRCLSVRPKSLIPRLS